jgi:hypothetical protein
MPCSLRTRRLLPEGGIEGDPAFQSAFTRNAMPSSDGRSLKDFQLLNRLFKYRCSYMVYSLTFQSSDPALKGNRARANSGKVLDGTDPEGRYAYLTTSEKKNIQRILAETLPDAPAQWKKALASR